MDNLPIKDSSGNEILRGISKLSDILGDIEGRPVLFGFPEKNYHRTIVNYVLKSFLPLKQGFLLFHKGFLTLKGISECLFIFYLGSDVPDYSLEIGYVSLFVPLDKGFFFNPADFSFPCEYSVSIHKTVFSGLAASCEFFSNSIYIL